MDQPWQKSTKTPWKRNMFSGANLEASFIDITLKTEKYAPREEPPPTPLNLHWCLSDTVRRIWTYNKSAKSHIIGMSTVNDHHLDLGLDSQDLQF